MNNLTFEASAEAVVQIKAALDKRQTPNAALRIGVRGGGCNGYMYHMEFCDSIYKDTDNVFLFINAEDGIEISIYIDRKSMPLLSGSKLIWEKSAIQWGFKIINPQAKSECGCKESFSV